MPTEPDADQLNRSPGRDQDHGSARAHSQDHLAVADPALRGRSAVPVGGSAHDPALSQYTPRTASYRRLCAQVKREESTCWICGGPIDAWRKWPDPMSYSTDHVQSCKTHPHLREVRSNLRAAHLVHNQERGEGNRKSQDQSALALSVDDF